MLELLYTCVANLAKIMAQREITLPDEQHHYIEKGDYNRCIYHKREFDATERTIIVMHDAEKLIELCDKTGDLDDGAFIVADGAYSGEENSQTAALHNLKLVTTNFTGRKPDEIYADFKFPDDGHLLLEGINSCTPSECIYDSGNKSP